MLDLLIELYRLRNNLKEKPSVLMKKQNILFKSLINHAYENVSYYHREFNKIGLKPDDIGGVSDIAKLPFTSKKDVQSKNMDDFIGVNYRNDLYRKTTTSGSTGFPLTVYSNKRASLIDDATWVRAHLERGLRLNDRLALLQDPRYFPKKNRWMEIPHILPRKCISIFDNSKNQIVQLEDFNPNIIRSYPSSLAILARMKNSLDIHPRLIFTSGELIDRDTRDLINSGYHAKLFDNYSSNELSLIAWECPEHIGYHINSDTMIVETIRDDEPAAPGERGQIVVTKLYNYTMPLIRYQIGDVAFLTEEKCTCGNPLPLIKLIEGRSDDFLSTTEGNLISPIVFFPFPFENIDGIIQFRVIQNKLDEIVIQVVLKPDITLEDLDIIDVENKMKDLFGVDMNIYLESVDELEADSAQKIRKIISNIK